MVTSSRVESLRLWNMVGRAERHVRPASALEGSATHFPASWLLSWLPMTDGFDGTHKYCINVIKGAWKVSSTWIHVINKVRCVVSGGCHDAHARELETRR